MAWSSLSGFLTIVLGLSALYAAFAVLASWLNEQVATFAQLRSRTLYLALGKLVGVQFAERLMRSRLIETMAPPSRRRKKSRVLGAFKSALRWMPGATYVGLFFDQSLPETYDGGPSYMSSAQFALALTDLLLEDYGARNHFVADVKALCASLPPDPPSDPNAAPPSPGTPAPPKSVRAVLANALATGNEDCNLVADAIRTNVPALRDAAPKLTLEQRRSLERILAFFASGQYSAAVALWSNAAGFHAGAAADLAHAIDRMRDAATNKTAADTTAEMLHAPLRAIYVNAQGQYTALMTGIALWYDNHMLRVTGWYKRCVQIVLVYIAIAFVLAFDVDTFRIVGALNNAQLATAVSAITAGRPAGATEITTPCLENAPGTSSPCAKCPPAATAKDPATCVVDPTALFWTVGWPSDPDRATLWNPFVLFTKIAGLALSAIAISLGAPIWFTLLANTTALRLTGLPPKPLDASSGSAPFSPPPSGSVPSNPLPPLPPAHA